MLAPIYCMHDIICNSGVDTTVTCWYCHSMLLVIMLLLLIWSDKYYPVTQLHVAMLFSMLSVCIVV